MADDTKLGIDIDVDGAWKLQRLKQQLKSVGRQARQLSKDSALLANQYFRDQKKLMNSSTGVWKRHFDSVDKMIVGFGKGLMKYVSFSAKFASIQVGALGLALMAVHAAFVVGQAAAKAYHAIMKVVAGGIASITIAATIAAAAIREHQAAMYAYKGTNMSEFGRGINQISTQMRMMQTDAQLATVGTEGLNAALAEIYKTGTYGGGQQKMLKALMDFGAAGQDIAKGAASAGKLIATLNDPKASFNTIKEAAKAMGPAMEQALTKLNITTKEGLQKAILDGSLAAAGGVEGQFSTVSGTLISQFKGAFTQIKASAADFGQAYLVPTKETFQEIVHIFRRGFVRVVPDLVAFGNGSLFEGLISGMEKLEDLFVKIMREYLPATKGMFDRLGEWWDRFMLGWNKMVESLRPMIDGSRVLLDMFRALGRELKGQGNIFSHTNQLLIDNKDQVTEFGSKIGKLLSVLMKYGQTLREIFFDVLPFINKIIDGITILLDAVFSLLGSFRGLFGGGGFGSLMLIMGLLTGGKSMSKNVGGFIKQRELMPMQTQSMQVNAGSVHITGATAAGQMNPNAARGFGNLGPGRTPPGGPGTGGGGGGGGGVGPFYGPGTPGTGLYGIPLPAGSASRTGGSMGQSPLASTAMERNALRRELMAANPKMTRAQAQSTANAMMGIPGSASRTGGMHPSAQRRSKTINPGTSQLRYEGDTAKFLRTMHAAKNDPLFKAQTLRESQMKYQNLEYDDFGNLKIDPKTGLPMTTWQRGGKRKWGWTEDTTGLKQDLNPGQLKTLSGKLFREPRNTYQYKKLFGDYETGQKGRLTGGSMAMNMGASMALGMASQYAPKEMQGALALGSSLATINPLLGAGVGLIGGGIASGNVGAGIGMGAAGGAALGARFGPWGAVIGGLGGAIIGGIGAWWNRNKRRKQEAKKAAERIVSESTEAFYEGLNKRLVAGGTAAFTTANFEQTIAAVAEPFDKFNQEVALLAQTLETSGKDAAKDLLRHQFLNKDTAISGYIGTQEELDRLLGDIETSSDTLVQMGLINNEVQTRSTERYTAVVKALAEAYGKSELEIINLAKETDTNLFDIRTGFDDLFKSIGEGLISTTTEAFQRAADAQAGIMDAIKTRQEQLAAPQAIDQAAAALYEAGQAGPLTEQQGLDFISQVMPLMTQYYGGDATQALLALSGSIGPGGTGFQEGSYFSSLLSPEVAALFQSEAMRPVLELIQSSATDVSRSNITDMLSSRFGSVGAGVNNTDEINKQIDFLAQTNYTEYRRLMDSLDPTKNPDILKFGTYQQLDDYLAQEFGLKVDTFTAADTGAAASQSADQILAALGLTEDAKTNVETAINTFADNLSNALNVTSMSVTSSNVNVTGITGDTSTPRGDTPSSRFRSTYVNHSYFDSLLSGKRTVTSGLRNFNLGSINSDHVTGRALDLTGQNLGMYKSAVEAAGGFAEFHGVNGARHLHVVPPSGPTGDSSTPIAASANNNAGISSSGSSGGGQYVININGYNKSPQQLANEVISVMRANERSAAERRGS